MRRTAVVATALWTLWGVGSGLQIWLSMWTHGHSLARIALYEVAVWDGWVPATLLVASVVRRWPLVPIRPALLGHAALALAIGVAHLAWLVGCMLVLVPYDRMNPTDFGEPYEIALLRQLPLEVALYAVVALAVEFRERDRRAAELERSLGEARRIALELQLQPHFLFNTLNAVGALVRCGQPAEAVAMIGSLSDLLRYALDRAGDGRVAIDDEVAIVRRYLEIQRLRFPDRLAVEVDLAPDARGAAVPVLLLQPLAENAIRHGIARSAGPGRIAVRVRRDGDALGIEVHNTGALDPGAEPGIGLANLVARLEATYGDRHRFELGDGPDGVVARVRIPWSPA